MKPQELLQRIRLKARLCKPGSSEEPEAPKSSHPKRQFALKALKQLGKLLLLMLVTTLGIVGFTFLRHQQLCSYQKLVDTSKVTTSKTDLCPNLLDTSAWGSLLKNAFDPSALQSLEPNLAYFNGGTDSTATTKCSDQLNPLCWLSGSKPKLKQTDGFTNMLLVGLDTRPGTTTLKNTDTMMLVSLDNVTGKVIFISFPRDLYLAYYRPNGAYVKYKLNAVYAIDGVAGLNGVIEQATGRKVHYYAYVGLDLFTKVIDRLGGVKVNLAEPFADLYPCADVPKGKSCPKQRYSIDGIFGLFEYPAGKQTFDSFEALVYARARKYSSDYERARRQQNLIKSVMQDALNSSRPLTERVQLYLDLYNIFREEVVTNIEPKDVAGLFTIIDKVTKDPISVVADPNFGGPGRIIYTVGVLPEVGWSITFRDYSYKQFHAELHRIWNNLAYYAEQPKVLVVNASGKKISSNGDLNNLVTNKPQFTSIKQTTNKTMDITGIRIYDFSKGKKAGSIRELQSSIKGSLVYNAEIDEMVQSSFKEDILIVYGHSEPATAASLLK